ncbi:hypothetical protein GCM10007320_61500 [Pseudorhodoferax aquiterrae]|uniref:Uncharacterized protein n=1 Tax=Pseudorhodoferax aquiterrae TaxID=747304 RepID=A0ABQ3GD83_9BURK|nr:hypothetical protein GCM10007320_61500 [Pseudorhodoferax aquiterrae]
MYHINMEAKKPHGGSRTGSGRKPLDADAPTVSFPVKMSTAQRDKLKRLGGAPWVRQKIDKEPEPKE